MPALAQPVLKLEPRREDVPVEAGHRSESAIEILEGIRDGDVVVLFPSDRVRDRARVKHRLASTP